MYIPGGRAAYPSTVLMTALPARVAGVRRSSGHATSRGRPRGSGRARRGATGGVTEAYRVGGAQAIAALAYGTATIRRVDKIVARANVYVALAKSRVFGEVGIDMVAGQAKSSSWLTARPIPNGSRPIFSPRPSMTRWLAPSCSPTPRRCAPCRARARAPARRAAPTRHRRRGHRAPRGPRARREPRRRGRSGQPVAPEHLELLVSVPPRCCRACGRGRGVSRRPDAGSRRRLRRGPSHVLPTAGTRGSRRRSAWRISSSARA